MKRFFLAAMAGILLPCWLPLSASAQIADSSQPAMPMAVTAKPDPCKGSKGMEIRRAACGWAHERGDGRPQDYAKALELYREAAERDDPRGQDLLGRLYRDGRGVPQDAVEAAKWFRKAAERLSNDGKADLGNLYAHGGKNLAPDYEEAFFWLYMPRWPHDGDFARLSDGRPINLAYDFGTPCIEESLEIVRKNLTEAQMRKVHERISNWKRPHTPADDQGDCLVNGNGYMRNGREKIDWCLDAVKRGYGPAMVNMGSMYNTGQVGGIPQDYAEAYFWWSLAVRYLKTDGALGDLRVKAITGNRDMAARKITPEQKAIVDKRVQDWKPTLPPR